MSNEYKGIKYKGFVLHRVDQIRDFRVDQNHPGVYHDCGKRELSHYEILDPTENMGVYCCSSTLKEAKADVVKLLAILDMKSNEQKEWDKLDWTKPEE